MSVAGGSGDPGLEALLRAARRGDGRALERLLGRLAPQVLAACRGVLGPAHPELEDAAQEALLALAEALPRFRGECRPERYAARIAARVALRSLHRWRRRDPPPGAWTALDPSHPPQGEAAERVARRRRLLRELLGELPPEQAEALVLRVVMDMRPSEIAEATGAPVNTVRSRLRLARERLARLLRERGLHPEEVHQ